MSSDSESLSPLTPHFEYSLNILDIVAIVIGILAILITIFIAYRTDHIATNTDAMLESLQSSNSYLKDIRDQQQINLLFR